MKTVRAKFKCSSITKQLGWGENKFLFAAKFNVVMGTSEENKLFFASTPSGEISVSTVLEDHFEVGKEYFVDFTVAE
jgi:hypothetical protein